MIVDEDVYLEHYGAKGMKWGVRKKNFRTRRAKEAQRVADRAKTTADIRPIPMNIRGAQNTQARADRLKRYSEGKQTSQDKALKVAQTTFVLGIGAAYIASSISFNRKLSSTPKRPSNSVVDVIKRTQKEQMSSLTRTFKEGHMDAAQYKNFSEKLNARYVRQIAEAMKVGV